MTAELTLKAEQLALFNTPVLVGGYVRKDGTTVPPHVSMRRKGTVREAPARDLFGPIDHPVARGAAPVQSHRHITIQELREAAKRAPRKPAPPAGQSSLFDADGAATPAAAPPPEPKAAAPKAPAKPRAPRKAKPKAAPAAEAPVPQFGAREGAKPAERKRDNAEALRILAAKTDEQMTAEDKAVLARYSGNGGIGDSLNEFYTRPDVATAMWGMLRKLGVEGGDVLEPSAGTGVYLHTAPESANVVAVELDPTSSRIARILHPGHEVNDGCLEAFARQDPRLFDGVIGNVPFGVRGAFIAQDKKQWAKAEAYFLDTALDKTRAGGIVALIVPTGVMDAQSNRSLRETLLRKGEFIAAHRLPNTAFEHSHTEVTSDVVIFRRRDPAVAQALMTLSQDQLKALGVWDDEYLSGAYFSGTGAPHVYGRMEAGWRAKAGIGDDITVTGDMHGVADALADWEPPAPQPQLSLGDILHALDGEPEAVLDRVRRAALTTPYEVAKPGDTKTVDGVTYVLQGRPPRWHRVDDAQGEPEHVSAARDLGAEIASLARGGNTDRAALAERIADYVKTHGNPRRDPGFMQRASGDPDLFRLLGAIRDDGSLSDLLAGRRVEGASVEALADKLSLDGGTFDVATLAQQSGMEPDAVEDLLHASARYASLPGGRWQTMGAYLTGELWPKLDAVRERLAAEGLPEHERAKLEAQAQRLEETIAPKSLEDVEVMLNSAWVPTDVVAKWMDSRVAELIEQHPTSSWYRELPPAEVTFADGVYKVMGGLSNERDLLAKYLNRTGVREDDMPAVERMNVEFKRWLLTSDHRDRVEDLYNRAYTGFVKGTYSNEPMEVPGLTADPKWRINDYHWGGLRWALDVGGGIIAADVGVGKAQPLDAKILTPAGWVRMGDIQPGDSVISVDGKAARVLGVFPQGEKEIFRITFSDGSSTEACAEHLWTTQTQAQRNNARRGLGKSGQPTTKTTAEIAATLTYRGGKNHSIPMVSAVHFDARPTAIHPYLLGVLLGDGCLTGRTPCLDNPEESIVSACEQLMPENYTLRRSSANGCPHYNVARVDKAIHVRNHFADELERLGLDVVSSSKRVPANYLFNTVEVRHDMLCGLMDTDGYATKNGTLQFTSVSKGLAEDVAFLVRSLGGVATLSSKIPTFTHNGEKRQGQRAYTLTIAMPAGLSAFRHSVKAARQRERAKYAPVRYVVSVESVGHRAAQCIAVDHPSQLYVTDDFIVTHNTPRGLILGRLLKAYGRAKKPMHIAPKSVLAKWVKDAKNWFPDAKVLVIGESYTEGKDGKIKVKTDSAAVINRKLHELAQNDYDFVFISKPAYNRIDLSPAEKARLVGDDFWAQRAEALGQAGDKRVRAARERFEQSVAKRDFENRSDVIYFDELGVDALIEDEAHTNKNLYSARARFGESPKFLGGSGQSNRAFDGYLKAKWMRERTGGKNVYDLTATPTKNSPLEIYSMLSRSQPEAFERLGIRNSEEFLDRFCVFERRMTLGINGGVEEALCTVGFKNLDELRGVMNRYIDRTTAEDVGLKLPEPEDVEHVLDMDADQAAVYADLREQAEQTSKKDATGDAHVFSIMDKMGKAALDLELLDPKGNKGYVSPKLRELTRVVAANKGDGGQIVFCEAVDTHEKIRGLLVKAGFKPEEIAIVNADEAETSLARQRISDDFNSGAVKVVIGNKTMEEGMDLQKLTSDIHHLDIPWEPATLQQRNGRGRRQGNANDRIRLHRYLSRGSFDGYRYQTVAAKRDWMSQLWTGGNRIDNLAMASALSREDMLVMLSADPEEARRKIAENKAEAEARLSEQRKADAAGEFVRFREMSRSLAGMKNKGTKAAARLQQQVQAARQRLEASRYFTAKDALDTPDAVVIDDTTGHVWRPGQAIEVDGGDAAPVNWSKGASRWVVDGVSPDTGGVRLRQYAGTARVTVEASKLRHGVKVVPHDPEAERMQQAADQLGGLSMPFLKAYTRNKQRPAAEVVAEMKARAAAAVQAVAKAQIAKDPEWSKTSQGRTAMWSRLGDAMRETFPDATDEHVQALTDHAEAQVMFAEHGKAPDDVKNPKDLVGLPDAFIQHNLPAITKHLRKKALAFLDEASGAAAVVGDDGELRIVKSYELRKAVSDQVRHALPIEADKEKLIHAYKQMERGRQVSAHYTQGRGSRKYDRSPAPGVRFSYPGYEYDNSIHGNPAAGPLRDLFPGAEADAQRQLRDESLAAARAAPTLRDAMLAIAPTFTGHYGGMLKWAPDQLAALAESAQRLGVLDNPAAKELPDVAGKMLDHKYGTVSWGSVRQALERHGWKPDGEAAKEAA